MNSGRSTSDFPSDGQEYFFDIGVEDAQHCLEEAFRTNSPRHRRSAVRAVFAFIDGCHAFVRGHVLGQASQYRNVYSIADLAVLGEESPYVDERGNVRIRSMRIPLITSIKLIVKIMEKNQAALHTVDLKHPGFSALSRAVEVRNRVVHPKNALDLDIADDEMQDICSAFTWYLGFAIRVNHASMSALLPVLQRQSEMVPKN